MPEVLKILKTQPNSQSIWSYLSFSRLQSWSLKD